MDNQLMLVSIVAVICTGLIEKINLAIDPYMPLLQGVAVVLSIGLSVYRYLVMKKNSGKDTN
tara:strand:+ start:496 stop:681 length:186 start_codon:yes stop_codon:yes gene_type:complete